MSVEREQFLKCTTRHELAGLIGVKTSTLTYFAFSKGKKYRTFTIPKKSGSVRTITAPVGALLEIQRRVASLLDEVYPAPSYVQGFVEGGSIVRNASLHLNKRLVLNIDLSDFFPSITTNRVIGLLRSKPFEFNNEVASTLAGLVCYKGSLPQGAPTSPVISNMICLRMDKALCALGKKEHATYSRYADDITFSTTKRSFSNGIIDRLESNKPPDLGVELIDIIERNYFQVNPRKTRISSGTESKYVTGVKVNLKPNVSRRYVRQIRSMLHAWEAYKLVGAQAAFSSDYGGGSKSFVQVVRGRLAHIKNVKGGDDLVYRRLYNRFVRLEGKGRPELPETEIEDLYSRIFVVESGKQHATGFILDGRWFITCAHALETKTIEYFTHSDSIPILHRKADVDDHQISPVNEFDLAAFAVASDLSGKDKSFESVASSVEVTTGMACKVLGFPGYTYGSQPHIMPVNVTNVEMNKYGILNAFVDKKMISGSSGSPVLNDKNQVIGMVQRGTLNRSTGDENIGYTFLPIQEIRRCLKQFEILSILELLSDRQL